MSDDLLIPQEETPVTVKPCPNCRKSHWSNTAMGEGYERLDCHECGLVLWGFSGLFTEEPAVAAWNIMSTRIEELEAQLATARADALREALNEVEETHTEASFFADKHGEEVLERVIGKILALIPEKDQ